MVNQKKNTILIVDDVPENLKLLADILCEQGFRIRPAVNGTVALRTAKKLPPDLILLDILMSDIDGYEVCKQLKAHENTCDIPIIFISAIDDISYKIQAFEIGGTDYITKPINKHEVLAKVNIHLSLRNMQKQLLEQNQKLKQEILNRKEIEKQLVLAKEAAETANVAKSEFLANMSHEIRTPMNAILGFSEILLSSTQDPGQKNYLNTIYSSGKILLTLIDDILDLSKVEAGRLKLQYSPINFESILSEIHHLFSRKIRKKNIKLEKEIGKNIPDKLMGDEVRIRQILINLLGNAVKFTSKGYVKISVYGDFSDEKKDKFNLTIDVEDTGIGIAADQQKLIFESFCQQAGQKVCQYGGTGLGLTITKQLVEMMKGSISVKSTLGKGSLFKVYLPEIEIVKKLKLQQNGFQNVNVNHLQFENSTILIVEDVVYNRALIKGYLKNTNISVIEAENFENAFEILKKKIPDLILMDLRLPGKSGDEITKIIKNNENLKNIPVIALTASVMKYKSEKIAELFDGYLSKPVSKKQLLLELKKFLVHKEKKQDKDLKKNQQKQEVFSNHLQDQLPELIQYLDNTIIPKWKDIYEVFFIDDITDFAQMLKKAANDYQINFLKNYSQNLYENSQQINIDAIEELIGKFPQIIDRIRELK